MAIFFNQLTPKLITRLNLYQKDIEKKVISFYAGSFKTIVYLTIRYTCSQEENEEVKIAFLHSFQDSSCFLFFYIKRVSWKQKEDNV